MAWQKWQQHSFEVMENGGHSYGSEPFIQTAEPSSQWMFEPDLNAPVWPQRYCETPVTLLTSLSSPGGFFSPTVDGSLNPFDASFGGVVQWENWDILDTPALTDSFDDGRSFSSDGLPVAGSDKWIRNPNTTLSSNLHGPFKQEQLAMLPLPRIPEIASSSLLSRRMANLPKARPNTIKIKSQQQDWNASSTTKSQTTPKADTTNYSTPPTQALSTQNTISLLSRPRVKHPKSHARFNCRSSITSSSPTKNSLMSNQDTSLVAFSAATSGLVSGSSRYHSKTEKKYRSRLNGEFSALLDALPKDLLASIAGCREKAISKVQVLDLAKRCIEELEREQADLKEESYLLRGQMDLCKRGFVGMGGVQLP